VRLHIFVIILFAMFLGGCATVDKSADYEIQSLRRQNLSLEEELQEAKQEILYMEEKLRKVEQEQAVLEEAAQRQTAQAVSETSDESGLISDKISLEPKDVQVALKNAGFYKGPIDGKLGRKTERAIIDFQKSNRLVVDGIIGKKTWAKLKDNL